jgi:hypothetical protein
MGDLDQIYEQRLMASPRRPASSPYRSAGENATPGTPGGGRTAGGAASSPASAPRDVISDRFIPSRGGTNLQASFALLPDEQTRAARKESARNGGAGAADGGEASGRGGCDDAYALLLRAELLGADGFVKEGGGGGRGGGLGGGLIGSGGSGAGGEHAAAASGRNLFRFKSARPARDENVPFSRSPVGIDSQVRRSRRREGVGGGWLCGASWGECARRSGSTRRCGAAGGPLAARRQAARRLAARRLAAWGIGVGALAALAPDTGLHRRLARCV